MVGRILLSHGMARLPPHLCSYLLMILFDTTPRTVRRLNEPALGSAQQDSHPSEDLSELPPLLEPVAGQ